MYGFELPLRGFSGRAADGRKELVYTFTPHVKGLVTDDLTIRVGPAASSMWLCRHFWRRHCACSRFRDAFSMLPVSTQFERSTPLLWVVSMQVQLPEGAHDIGVEVPFEAELSYEPKCAPSSHLPGIADLERV